MKLILKTFVTILVIIIITGCTINEIKKEESENTDTNVHVKRINELLEEVSELEEEVNRKDTTIKLLEERIKRVNDNTIPLDSTAEFEFKQLGVSADEVVEDLYNRPDLIPMEGVLGGTMQFSKESIYLLNHKWIFATFADGHTGGNALYEFSINDDKSIEWKLIDEWKMGNE